MTIGSELKREARVAFSTKAQPIWFRVAKWAVIILIGILFWRSALFWWLLLVAFIASMALHLFWRWKTHGWTQPWGGWNDPDAGRR
jgi:hypothetical protein